MGDIQESNEPRKGMKRRWSISYKRRINCNHPRGFSQKNYCKRQRRGGGYTESFKTWLENNEKKLLILVHSDYITEVSESATNEPEMLGELFNRDPYELVSFLREKLREDASLRFNIVANWVNVNTVRGAKAILDSWASRLNIDSFTVRATREQYLQDPNAFESGIRWEEIV
jgi:hypothetical protein